jgi:Phosphotransferase enzyme family
MTTDFVEIVDYLLETGQLGKARVTALAGGVSAETLLVECEPSRLVIKRALGRLLVPAEWTAKTERAMTEAAAISLLHDITPACTPRLRYADAARNLIVMDAAPADWVPWKSVLLGQVPDPTKGAASTAACLGAILADWHERTWHDDAVAARFDDREAFQQLRVVPFHHAVARVHVAFAGRIEACAMELEARRDCLVHGDFSPKNVLVGEDGLMVIDFEVAHVGAAVFDVAFLQCHLILKALHMPARAIELAEAAAAFVNAYQAGRTAPPSGHELLSHLGWHTACLLLARVDGVSTATYLTQATAEVVRRMALGLLVEDDPSGAQMWDRVLEAAQ